MDAATLVVSFSEHQAYPKGDIADFYDLRCNINSER